jgi:hypothetical protein
MEEKVELNIHGIDRDAIFEMKITELRKIDIDLIKKRDKPYSS